jgi:hypothetical protein
LGEGTLEYYADPDRKIEGITWSLDGEILYGAGDGDVYTFDPNGSRTWVHIASLDGFGFSEIEGLETDVVRSMAELMGDVLILGEHGDERLYYWNTYTGNIDYDIDTYPFSDTEGIVVCKNEGASAAKLGLEKMLSEHVDLSDPVGVSEGDQLEYTIVATNLGSVELSNVTVTDPMFGASLVCVWPGEVGFLAPGQFVECTGTHAVTEADVGAGSIHNTATADSCQTDKVTDSVTVEVGQPPVELCEDNFIYSVFDEGGGDSQFFSVDPSGGGPIDCGPLYDDTEFESLESIDGVLYAVSSEGTGTILAGDLVELDGNCNFHHVIGTGYTGIEGLAVHPVTGELWGVIGDDSSLSDGSLVIIDVGTGATAVAEEPPSTFIEAITWSYHDPNILYGAGHDNIYIYDFGTHTWETFDSSVDVADGAQIEGLETDIQGSADLGVDILILGVHGKDSLDYWNTNTKSDAGSLFTDDYNDNEGIVVCK